MWRLTIRQKNKLNNLIVDLGWELQPRRKYLAPPERWPFRPDTGSQFGAASPMLGDKLPKHPPSCVLREPWANNVVKLIREG